MDVRSLVRCFPALCAIGIVCGCRHPMDDYEKSLVAGDYAKAFNVAFDEISDGGNDELMWRLMAGGAGRLAGMRDETVSQFDRAEDVMIDQDGRSVFSKGVTGTWAMMTNEKAFPYDGGGLDRIMTCLYKAIDFASVGNPAGARTELNRAALHQENWLYERRKEIDEARDRLDKDAADYQKAKQAEGATKVDSTAGATTVSNAFANADFAARIKAQSGFDMAVDGNLETLQSTDWMNPYAAHVMGVFRWLNGDDCLGSLKDAAACSKGNAVPVRDVAECERKVKPKDQVWLWLEEGLGPKREEWRIDLPLILIPYANRFVMYAGMAFPRLVYRPSAGSDWRIATSGGTVALTELVDMDAKAKLEFDVYFREALVREITRTTVKVGTQVALGIVAECQSDWRVQCALRASQLAVAGWAAATTGADTRSWTTLPKKIHAVRIDRPADGKVVLSSAAGNVAEISVPAGNSMVFVSKPSAQAAAAVKIATYP